ncbi:hypothetical protein BGX26_010890 [Mortierella sp. AD094]|nr:hypothetical protein BGX26_010890 [Mortierella sp. AD094]
MSYTSTLDTLTNTYRHDLLLGINTVNPSLPILLRLSRQSSNTNNATAWTATDQSSTLQIPYGARRVWLASGAITVGIQQQPELEGSGLFQLLTSPTSTNVQNLDMSGSLPSLVATYPIPLNFFDNSVNPKIVRLRNEDLFDVAIVGGCVQSLSAPTTCIVLLNEMQAIQFPTNMLYDPTSCIVATNGTIVMASTSGIWTLPYLANTPTWTSRQPPGFLPNLPTPILACTVANSKLYAVLQGNAALPTIKSIDLRGPNWDWQNVQLTQVPNSGGNGGSGGSGGNRSSPFDSNGSGSSNSANGLSAGVIVAIIAVIVVLLLLGFGFFWWRRRNTKKMASSTGEIEKAEYTAATSQPTSVPGYAIPATQQTGSWEARPSKQELFEYEQPNNGHQQAQPQVSRSWSSNSTTAVDAPYGNPSYQQSYAAYPSRQVGGNAPTIVTSMPNTVAGRYVHSSSSPMSSNYAGDKQELTSEDQVITPASAASNTFLSPRTPNASSPTNGRISPNDPRTLEVLSPGLVNAQLILQRSQTPQN